MRESESPALVRRKAKGFVKPAPGECVNVTSVNMFKNKIDNYFKRSGYV